MKKNEVDLKLEKLLKNWENFVREIEETYEGTIDDYIFDLSHRDEIEDIISSLSDSSIEIFRKKIKEFDNRFLLATEEYPRLLSVIDHLQISKEKFWYFRKPKKLTEYLQRYFT